MSWNQGLTKLQEILSELYDDIDLSRQVVAKAELPDGKIRYDAATETNWYNILEKADRHDKVATIVAVAAEEFPAQQAELEQGLQLYAIRRQEADNGDAPAPHDEQMLPCPLCYGVAAFINGMLIVLLALWFEDRLRLSANIPARESAFGLVILTFLVIHLVVHYLRPLAVGDEVKVNFLGITISGRALAGLADLFHPAPLKDSWLGGVAVLLFLFVVASWLHPEWPVVAEVGPTPRSPPEEAATPVVNMQGTLQALYDEFHLENPLQVGITVSSSRRPDPHLNAFYGLDWIRFAFSLAALPEDSADTAVGDLDTAFKVYDPLIQAFTGNGSSVLLILGADASSDETIHVRLREGWPPFECYSPDEQFFEQYAAEVRKIAVHYAPYGDQIAYEIWPSPDRFPQCLPAEQYTRLLSETSSVIRSAAPEATILLGGGSNLSYLRSVRDEYGAALPVDAVALHPHLRVGDFNPFDWNFGTIGDLIAAYRELFPATPLWITEIGVGNDRPIPNENYDEIARYMLDVYDYVDKRYYPHVPVMIWYGWSDLLAYAGIVDGQGKRKDYIYDAFMQVKDARRAVAEN